MTARLANLDGRLVLLVGDALDGLGLAVDVETVSEGRFGPDPMSAYADWPAFVAWATTAALDVDAVAVDPALLGPPVPQPRQVFAAGMNYGARAAEGGVADIALPPIFTKFASCLTGPYPDVVLPTQTVDWEAELVVVIGVLAHHTAVADAWQHVAGLMIGQDLSERVEQFRPPVAQFSMAKSYPGFGPTGPWLLATEGVDPGPLDIGCWVGHEQMQSGSTGQMTTSVAELLALLSANVPLLPGDLVFTGSPGGVGHHRNPPRYLRPGETLRTTIDGLGAQQVTLR
ncbi:fumarylacetoacetate hydrolase family protein [Acidothermaceae bacterium B102]|nr:fumarylacetoacetate hydrolase family protein [Acidothermaceae bacterium B102]